MTTAIPDVVSQTRELFIKYVGEFLQALGEKFPSCDGVRKMRLAFGVGVEHAITSKTKKMNEEVLIKEYDTAMQPYYARITSRDCSIFAEAGITVDFLKGIDISKKWESSDEDTRECIYDYLDLMNRFARMYSLYTNVPSGMMHKITQVASNLASDLNSGQSDLSTINLAKVGQQVVSQIDAKELQQFATSLMANQSQMQGVMNLVASMHKN